jgi:D-aminopeptidase
MLHGAPAESLFGDHETARVIDGTRTLQFEPGTRFSYVNQNFRMLGDIVAARTGVSFAELLRTRIFDRVGMETAFLAADTSAMPDGATGYEGSPGPGYRPAENRILWTGDAGMGACLDDMIAWETYIDATRDDPEAIYSRLSAPVTFADGAPVTYGFGLGRAREFGRALTGHGGGLRGWTSHRLNSRGDRISVVVLFNHISNAQGAAIDLLGAALDEARPKADAGLPTPTWTGAYVEPETGLAVRIDAGGPGTVRVRFGQSPAVLDLQPDGTAGVEGRMRLRPAGGGLMLERPNENAASRLTPLRPPSGAPVVGRYRNAELDAELTVVETGGVAYGAVSGFLGQGRMELLEPIGEDVWALPCPRALDFTPPGDWTLAFRRDTGGTVTGVDIGCWLARQLPYARID